MKKQMLVVVVCATVALCSIPAARAADPDVTGLEPTIWWDFETQPSASELKGANKGSASISFTGEGTKTYSAGAISGTFAIDTSRYTPYSKASTCSTAGNPFTVSAVMTLGTNPNGITLNVRTTAGDLIIRRGADAGSLVIGWGKQEAASANFLNATLSGGDSAYHLVSVIASSAGTELYVDGTLVASSTEFTPWSSSGKVEQMQFGSHLGAIQTGEARLGGCIDDLRIHDAALTPAQMRAIAVEYGLSAFSDGLIVSGTPGHWGAVIPAYGVTSGLSQGGQVACSALGVETETTKTVPIGYSLYSVASDGVQTLVDESTLTSFTYTHGSDAGHLVWHWVQSNLVSVTAGQYGAVTPGGWVGYGESFTVTATPYGGYKFLRWTGDTAGIDTTSASVVLPSVTKPVSLVAEFLDENTDETVQYVSPDGDDTDTGYSRDHARKTIAAAVATLSPTAAASSQRCTIHVAPGLYPISTPIVVTNAIHVLGTDPDPSRTIVSNAQSIGWGFQNQRCFILGHSDAIVANVTMQKGGVVNGYHGGNFFIQASGGMVTNCIVEQSSGSSVNSYAVGAYLEGGLVTHTIFRKNTCGCEMGSWQGAHGGVLELRNAARAENCLFTDNPQKKEVYLIYVAGTSILRNCTIVDSGLSATNDYCKTWSAVHIGSANATVQNVVVAGVTNTVDGAACPPTGSVTRFLNGAFDGDVTGLPVGTVTGTAATFFKDYGSGDYRPKTGGVLVNKGQNYEPTPAKDLGGNKRLIGSKIDIGCYEANAAEFCIRVR